MKKITRTTLKSFINQNKDSVYVKNESSFSGMTDCIETLNGSQFIKAEYSTDNYEYTLGVAPAWFVGSSRDYFTAFENEEFTGYEVCNCCGKFIVATRKGQYYDKA